MRRLQILWAFSIYLEALAILPQLIVLQRYGEVENLTGNYIFMLGLYRALYIANWIYRAKTEPHYHTHLITIISGVVQTALYVDFFYHYATSKMLGKKIEGAIKWIDKRLEPKKARRVEIHAMHLVAALLQIVLCAHKGWDGPLDVLAHIVQPEGRLVGKRVH